MEFLRRLQHKAVELVDSTQPAKTHHSPSSHVAADTAKFLQRMERVSSTPLSADLEKSLTSAAQRASLAFLQQHSSVLGGGSSSTPKRGHRASRKAALQRSQSVDNPQPLSFTFLGEKHSTVRVYDAFHEDGQYVVKGTTTVPGSVFDVLSALQMHGNAAFAVTMQEVFGQYFDQGMTLHTPPHRSTTSTATTSSAATTALSLAVDSCDVTPTSGQTRCIDAEPPVQDDLDGVGLHWMALKPSRAMESSYKASGASSHGTPPGSRCDVVFTSYSQMYEPASTDDDDDDEGASHRAKAKGGAPLVPTRRNSPLVTCGTHIWDSTSLSIAVASSSTDRRRLALVQGGAAPGHRRLAFNHSGVYVEKVRTPTHADLTSITLVMSLTEILPRTQGGSVHGHRHPRHPHFDVSPSRPVTQWMQRLALSVLSLSRLARQRQGHGSKSSLVPKDKWAMNDLCGLCDEKFNMFRRRHHCRLCGTAICSACSCSMDVEFPVLADGRILNQTTVRSCTKCAFVGSTMQRLPAAMLAHHEFFGRPPPPVHDQTTSRGELQTAPGRMRRGRSHVAVGSDDNWSHHHHPMLEPQRHDRSNQFLGPSTRRSAHISLVGSSPRHIAGTPRMCRTPQPVKSTSFTDLSGGTGMTRLDRQDRMFRRDLRDSWEQSRTDDAAASFQAFPLVGSRGVRLSSKDKQDSQRQTPRASRRTGAPPLAQQSPMTTNSFPSSLSTRGIQARRLELLQLANMSPSDQHQTTPPHDQLHHKDSLSRGSTDSEDVDPAATPRGSPGGYWDHERSSVRVA